MIPVQQTPQVFTLIVVLSVLASIVVLLLTAYTTVRGQWRAAGRLLGQWAIGAAIYLTISVGVSVMRPARLIEQGQDWCFDEWCIAVEAVHHMTASNGTAVVVTTDLRISNTGKGPESVRGFWALLQDDHGRRYAPAPGPWQQVMTSAVPGHGSAWTSMEFVVPTGATPRGFLTNHGGGSSPCAWLPSLLEIGQGGCLFHKSNMIRIG